MTAKELHPAYRLILPYLRQIEDLILDPEISEIMINSPSDDRYHLETFFTSGL